MPTGIMGSTRIARGVEGREISDINRSKRSSEEIAKSRARAFGCAFGQARITSFRSFRDATVAGFLDGFGSAFDLDLFGELTPTFYRRAPFVDDLEALTCDWRIVGDDLDEALRAVADEVLAELRAAVVEGQEVLFDADFLDSE